MGCRQFHITLISAKDLEVVNRFYRMKVYAKVSIGRDGPEKHTRTDEDGETNPAWDFATSFTITESVVNNNNTKLVVKLFCRRTMGDKYIGEVRVPMKELSDISRAAGGSADMSLPVQRGCKNSQGELRFSYRFGEREMGDPSEKGPKKGSGQGFPWEKAIKVLIEGIELLIKLYGSGRHDNDNYGCRYGYYEGESESESEDEDEW